MGGATKVRILTGMNQLKYRDATFAPKTEKWSGVENKLRTLQSFGGKPSTTGIRIETAFSSTHLRETIRLPGRQRRCAPTIQVQ
mmetsp:Transcript_3185/g.7665  ORF Transcript_3185/g.7665 Transcript_3185/m.7665 type:complete len:84 (-) Transcript_3185:2983-3234(-)